MKRLACELKKVMGDTFSLYGELLKVMIPVMILVRLAVEFGTIEFVGKLIAPVMGWVGLPGEMGFVWVTAMIVNIYAGAAALLTILPECPLTIAQATILGSMILIAHSLPIEQRIAQKTGNRSDQGYHQKCGSHRRVSAGLCHPAKSCYQWKYKPGEDESGDGVCIRHRGIGAWYRQGKGIASYARCRHGSFHKILP